MSEYITKALKREALRVAEAREEAIKSVLSPGLCARLSQHNDTERLQAKRIEELLQYTKRMREKVRVSRYNHQSAFTAGFKKGYKEGLCADMFHGVVSCGGLENAERESLNDHVDSLQESLDGARRQHADLHKLWETQRRTIRALMREGD